MAFNKVVASGILPPPGYDAWLDRQVEAQPLFSWANVVSSGGDCRIPDDEFQANLPDIYECEVLPPLPFLYEEDDDDDGVNVIISSDFTPPPIPLKINVRNINFSVRPPMVLPEEADLSCLPPDTDAYPHLLSMIPYTIRHTEFVRVPIVDVTPISHYLKKHQYNVRCEHQRMIEKCMSFFDHARADEMDPILPSPCGLFKTVKTKVLNKAFATSVKRVRKISKFTDDDDSWYDPQVVEPEIVPIKHRNPELLAKLRDRKSVV